MPTSYIPGIHRWRVRGRPRSHTRRGMRNAEEFDFENKPVDECLREMKCSEPYHEFDIVLKCFDMFSDTAAEQLKGFETHCGEHTAITRQCLCSDKFQALLTDCRDRAQELWKNKSHLEVVCCCSEGWHPSVAMASILRAIFALQGYNAVGPLHLSKSTCWSEMCSTYPECMSNQEKSEMFSAVQATFRN